MNTINNQSVMETYAEVMNSDRIYNDSLAFLQLQPVDIKDYTYESTALPSSSILELSVKGPKSKAGGRDCKCGWLSDDKLHTSA
ncbi:MAG: hypothetical protein ACMG55_14880 [Microcoleus sp.]